MNAKVKQTHLKQNNASYTEVQTAIVGGGFGGLAMAIKLLKSKRVDSAQDFLILEKNDQFGGTWYENSYPGAACDVQSHMYSFSFEPKHDWTKRYAPWQEIQAYILSVAKKYDLASRTRFNSEVVGAVFDEQMGKWTLDLADGSKVLCKYFILASGPLHVPNMPEFKGMKNFKGEVFHSSHWNHDYDLAGKKVISIGTGGSAIQYVPKIAPIVDKLYVLQRTAAWVIPRDERKYLGVEKAVFNRFDILRKIHRARLYWSNESRVLPIFQPKMMKIGQKMVEQWIRFTVKDKQTAANLTPDYVMGCKRILISNTYYPTFNRNNVDLVQGDPIDHVLDDGVVLASGRKIEADAIIYGTGFITDPRIYMKDFKLEGLTNHVLQNDWKNGAESYMGITTTGYPNMYQLVGPNTGLGHNSIIFMIEAQVDYILDLMQKIQAKKASYADVTPKAQKGFNEKVQKDFKGTVWQTGCASWYTDDEGKNFTLWPGFTWQYWLKTRRVKEKAYNFVKSKTAKSA